VAAALAFSVEKPGLVAASRAWSGFRLDAIARATGRRADRVAKSAPSCTHPVPIAGYGIAEPSRLPAGEREAPHASR
jgi:hypothetical protein